MGLKSRFNFRSFQKAISLLALSLVLSSGALAKDKDKQVECTGVLADGYCVYKQPWTEMLSNESFVADITKITTNFLQVTLMDLQEQSLVPEQLLTLDDLRALNKATDKIDAQVAELNNLINEYRLSRGGDLELSDAAPDALLVFAGGKYTSKWAVSKGGSVSVGAIILPQKVTKVNMMTGKTEVSPDISLSLVVWPTVDALIQLNPTSKKQTRWGFGFIWDTKDQMVSASDFSGGGLAGSFSYTFGALKWVPWFGGNKMNFKVGALSKGNSDLGYISPDFVFATVSKDQSVNAVQPETDLSVRMNLTTIVGWEAFAETLDNTLTTIFGEREKQLKDGLKKLITDEIDASEKPADGN